MKTTRPGARFPRIYQAFASVQEIADTINRSPSYVKKALKEGFTERERTMLAQAKNRTDLFEERTA
jgi:hypothetical protein